ncbi:HD domain-containing protein [Paraliobacillus quinghaiensis]|uniref:bis(5'-nucleosyl)-tetraphosphatase (symmetrical) n=1 Tax=Paraliobacillus quinghaiensis TaxID=470815 RepID=A0A917TNV5_9BACI|nr:bis(5'-nucleosyl)-tetraphosphatase (symmetrical) YqeK [Paraliobacillus quinghaiensis]GGM31055.1 HD domain-containing protein [Paraliobacillus quinghaiensis]
MNRTEALEIVRKHLKLSRYEHTIRVTDTAVDLAEYYGQPIDKIELAAILHDYAKYRDKNEMRRWIETSNLPKDLLQYHSELWHGPVGALLVKFEVGIEDQLILDAIHCHTTGKAHMNMMEKIIFLADYIEPGRDFPGLDTVRIQAKKDLDYACFLALKNTIDHLVIQEQLIYPDALHAYNDLLRKIKVGE